MQRELEHDRVSAADLDKTDELPVLNVAEYEATLAAQDAGPETAPADPLEFTWEDARTHAATVAPEETLRAIDEWIEEQNARDRASQRALAQLRTAEAEASARATQLAVELENVRAGLKVALGRANDSERALLEAGAAQHSAEARVQALTSELEAAHAELRATSAKIAALETDGDRTRQALAASEQMQAQQATQLTDVGRALADRTARVTTLEADLAALQLRITDSEGHVARHGEAIAKLTAENSRLVDAQRGQERARLAAEARSSGYFERIQTHEWHRGLWDGMWRDLDADLAEARATITENERRLKAEADVAAQLRAELGEAQATIKRLEAAGETQAGALRALADARTQDVGTLEATVASLSARNEELGKQLAALVATARETEAALAARERELAEVRASAAALEQKLRTATDTATAQATRIAELESVTVNVAHALQAQTLAAESATAAAEASSKESRAQLARLEELEAALGVATRHATEQTAAAAAAQSALAIQAADLTAARDRLASAAEDARTHAARIAELEQELTRAHALTEQGDAPRRALELELGQVRSELASQTQLVGPLESRCLELALELEKTRGVLEERERRLRQVERHAAKSAEVLGRIKSGLGANLAGANPDADARDEAGRPAFVPLTDDGQGPLVLGRRTTIGRAPDNDVCIPNSSVSRHHALVVCGSRGSFIEDHKSVNGVLVNGQRVRQARLVEGDIVSLGEVQYRFTRRAPAEHSAH